MECKGLIIIKKKAKKKTPLILTALSSEAQKEKRFQIQY